MVEPAVAGGSTTTADASQGRASVHKKIVAKAVRLIYELLDNFKLGKKDDADKRRLCDDLISRPLTRGVCILAQECIEYLANNHSDVDLVNESFKVNAELDSAEKELAKVDKKTGPKDQHKVKSTKKIKTKTKLSENGFRARFCRKGVGQD